MKTKGMPQQIDALRASYGKRNFAYLMEMGTGKTWTTLADAERAFIEGKIDALAVIAPKGVHTNWVRREIPTHLGVRSFCVAWRGKPTSKKRQAELDKLFSPFPDGNAPTLRVFTINIDAVNRPEGYETLEDFLKSFRTMLVMDESTRIKNPQATRTKKCIKLRTHAEARRILSGKPITKGPIDLYSQFEFLKSGLLGTTSYRAFVAEFAVLVPSDSPKMQAILRKTGARGIPQVVETDENGNKLWKNLDKLHRLIQPHSFRVRKDECLSLPPKVYKQLTFQLSPSQRKVYERLEEDYAYITRDLEDKSFQAIAARTKMKQVTSGFIHIDGAPVLLPEDQADSDRMALFKEVIEDVEGQAIVWAMFEEEIDQIVKALKDAGKSVVTYYGKTKAADREKAIDDFQAGKADWFVGHAAAAGIGLTLTAAETMVYYSCSFDNELRSQSEDRAHRIGQTKTVVIIDLVAEDTIDEDVLRSLASKTAVADYVVDGR